MKREPKNLPNQEETLQTASPADALQDPDPSEDSGGGMPADQKPVQTEPSSSGEEKPAAKKKTMRQTDRRISLFSAVLFFACLLIITILFVALPRTGSESSGTESSVQWPFFTFRSALNGSFNRQVMQFYDSTVPVGETLTEIGDTVRVLLGKTSWDPQLTMDGGIEEEEKEQDPDGIEASLLSENPEENTGEETLPASGKDYHIENADVIDENGYLVIRQDGHWRALSLYTGVDVTIYADTVNYVRQMIDPAIRIYVMPAPLACQFYIPSNYQDSHEDMENTFRDLLSKLGSGITAIDVIEILNAHNTQPIYLRTDHHWAYLGAYYAAEAFAETAGVPFADLDTYEKNIRENFVGSMYEFTGSANLLNDPEDFVYYIPASSYIADYYGPDMTYLCRKGLFSETSLSASYDMALGKDDQIIRILTDAGNSRKLLVIKDSFGNAAIPFLTGSFEEIYVIDQRYFNFNLVDYIHQTGVTDILFLHDYYSLAGSEAELLEYITYSNLDTSFRDPVQKPDLDRNGNPDINGSEILYAEDVLGYNGETSDNTGRQTESETSGANETNGYLYHKVYEEKDTEETDSEVYWEPYDNTYYEEGEYIDNGDYNSEDYITEDPAEDSAEVSDDGMQDLEETWEEWE